MRVFVKYKRRDGTKGECCIACDRMEREGGRVFAYRCNALVGVFDLGNVDLIYLS